MSSRTPPAGWYDDPAGTGGTRFWDGRVWTDDVRGGSNTASTSAGGTHGTRRLPQGHMMLNGRQVPLGTKQFEVAASQRRGTGITMFVIVAVFGLLAFGLAQSIIGNESSGGGSNLGQTCEIVDDDGTTWPIEC